LPPLLLQFVTQLHETFILCLRGEKSASSGEQLLATACKGLTLSHEFPLFFLQFYGDRPFINAGE
jgi:uracil DNA glycosylase